MKKLLIPILILLFLSFTTAYAESIEAIEFRNIPWGSSIVDVQNNLSEIPGHSRISKDALISYSPYWGNNHYARAEKAGFKLIFDTEGEGFYVAGHAVNTVYLSAVYGIVDGEISKETYDSKLISADYVFAVNNATKNALYDDLYSKLCDLYGAPYTTTDKPIKSSTWLGSDNTGVYMYTFASQLYVTYGKTDSYVDIGNLLKIRNETKDVENNRDGL